MIAHFADSINPDLLRFAARNRRNPFAAFDASLISFKYWQRYPRPPTNGLVVGDSGGFSVATLGVRLDPTAAIRWRGVRWRTSWLPLTWR